jgi:hypothetical protein
MRKKTWTYLMVGGLLVGMVNVSQARVRAWIVINPFPLMVAPQPVVVAQPVAPPAMVPDPYAAPPPDYRQVLDNFHNRVGRLQRVLDRQLNRRIITQAQYDRHADDLEGIIREEQQDAARHNGALTPREVNDLNRRLTELQDRIHEDIAR